MTLLAVDERGRRRAPGVRDRRLAGRADRDPGQLPTSPTPPLERDGSSSGVETVAGERVGASAVPVESDGETALGRGPLEPARRRRRQRRPDPPPDPDRGRDRARRRVADRLLGGGRGLAAAAAAAQRGRAGRRGRLQPADPDRLAATSSGSSRAASTRCSAGSSAWTARARSSSPTPRTSCARRSSRSAASSSCSRPRTRAPRSAGQFVGEMRGQIERLQKLTADLLDLSKLDADAMEIQRRAGGPEGSWPATSRRSSGRGRESRDSKLAGARARPGAWRWPTPIGSADHPYPDRQCAHAHTAGDEGDGDRRPRRRRPPS